MATVVVNPDLTGGGYTSDDRTDALHAIISGLSAGANTIHFPAAPFLVSRKDAVAGEFSGNVVLFELPSETTLTGETGWSVVFDESSEDASSTSTTLFQFGAGSDAVTGMTVTGMTLDGSGAAVDPDYLAGIGNRRDTATATADDVTFTDFTATDVSVAITNARRNQTASLGANRDSNWTVDTVEVTDCSNRAIELSQIDGATITDYTFTNCDSGLHLAHFANDVTVTNINGTGIADCVRLNAATTNCTVSNGTLAFVAGSTSTYGSLHFHAESTPTTFTTSGNTFEDLVLRRAPHSDGVAMDFYVNASTVAATWTDMDFVRCTFRGSVDCVPFYADPAHTISELRYTDCVFEGNYLTTDSTAMTITGHSFTGCTFKGADPIVLHADGFTFTNCTFHTTPIIGDDATNTTFSGCTFPTAIESAGTGTTLTSNVVDSSLFVQPVAVAI